MSLTNGQAECAVAGTLANAAAGKSYAIVHKTGSSFTVGQSASNGAIAINDGTVSGTVNLTQGSLEYFALTEDGDIDMEKALAYQTDFEALKASLDAKTVDPSKPVSENSNEDTLEAAIWHFSIIAVFCFYKITPG